MAQKTSQKQEKIRKTAINTDTPHETSEPVADNKFDHAMNTKFLPFLKYTLNILIIVVIIALLVTIVYKLFLLFTTDIVSKDLHNILDNILFTLILIELFTILYAYFQKHYVKVERIVEIGIISIVREVIFQVYDLDSGKIYAISALLIALGLLFFIEKYYSKNRNV